VGASTAASSRRSRTRPRLRAVVHRRTKAGCGWTSTMTPSRAYRYRRPLQSSAPGRCGPGVRLFTSPGIFALSLLYRHPALMSPFFPRSTCRLLERAMPRSHSTMSGFAAWSDVRGGASATPRLWRSCRAEHHRLAHPPDGRSIRKFCMFAGADLQHVGGSCDQSTSPGRPPRSPVRPVASRSLGEDLQGPVRPAP